MEEENATKVVVNDSDIDLVMEKLNSKNNALIYETIVRVKNLIIGNNKYKAYYLKDHLINRLLELINDYYLKYLKANLNEPVSVMAIGQQPAASDNIDTQFVEIINQIIIIFSSFSLSNLDHVRRLIDVYNLHELLFNLIRLNRIYFDASNATVYTNSLRLIESSLRCLSNLYTSSQMMLSLGLRLDAQLYFYDLSTKQSINLDTLEKLYNMNETPNADAPRLRLIKTLILNMLTVSSVNLMHFSTLNKVPGEIFNYRTMLVKSHFVQLFAPLLLPLNGMTQTKTQLNCLKFYQSIAFECAEGARLILATSYYDYGLLDLISAYLSRENSAELQLYASKCIANLYRSSCLLLASPNANDEANDADADGDGDGTDVMMNVMNVTAAEALLHKHNSLVKLKTLPTLVRLCSTYSLNYRNAGSASASLNFGQISLLTSGNDLCKVKLIKQFNTLLLIESISTLTYLIETNSELQLTASYLEQIVQTLIHNVNSAFNNFNSLSKIIATHPPPSHYRNYGKRLLNTAVKSAKAQKKSPHSSLYSLFYLYYNQFVNRSIGGKLNEHQYNYLTSLMNISTDNGSNLFKKSSNFIKNLELNVHKRLISVSLHALSCLALNNEEARRAIGENSDFIKKLILILDAKSADDVDSNDPLHDTAGADDDTSSTDSSLIVADEVSCYDEDFYEFIGNLETDEDTKLAGTVDTLFAFTLPDANLLKISALCLMHSLSRSVHQLRTKFLDVKLTNTISYMIRRVKLKKDELKRARATATDELEENNNNNKKYTNKTFTSEPNSKKSTFDQDELEIECDMNTTGNTATGEQDEKCTTAINETTTNDDDFTNRINSDDYNFIDFSINEQNFISLLLAIMANLLIDFSPCKETFVENDVIKTLIEFIDYNKSTSIRINSIWALMNLAYQSNQTIKQKILKEITIEKLFQLLTEQDETLVIKTLGLIRNLICSKIHIDLIMNLYGNKIIQAIIMILEGEYYNHSIKEQALCILANIADGANSKNFIMENEDLLRKINSFMTHNQPELQVAAVYCVLNLVNVNDEGAYERQSKLKEIGAHRILQKLLTSSNPVLFDKVKTALQQFPPTLPNNHTSSSNVLLSS